MRVEKPQVAEDCPNKISLRQVGASQLLDKITAMAPFARESYASVAERKVLVGQTGGRSGVVQRPAGKHVDHGHHWCTHAHIAPVDCMDACQS